MALNSSTVVAGNDALATDYNTLRLDALELGGEYAVTTGSSGAYLLSLDAQITAYATGMTIKFEANHTHTSTAPTINVNSIGARTLTLLDGSTTPARHIQSGDTILAVYDGTNFVIVNKQVLPRVTSVMFSDLSDTTLTSSTDIFDFQIDGRTLQAGDLIEVTLHGMKYDGNNSVGGIDLTLTYGTTDIIVANTSDVDIQVGDMQPTDFIMLLKVTSAGNQTGAINTRNGADWSDTITAGTEDETTDLNLKLASTITNASDSIDYRAVTVKHFPTI